ncbi:MAG: cytidylate kinase-like family protein [Bacillota bacterium]|nr:cytidylate kinase-like family protein [Bacillota bacterium]
MAEIKDNKRVITISREYGSGGRIIGRKLAEKLGVPYYDKDTINRRIAEESGFDINMLDGQEKKAKNSFLYSLASAMGAGDTGPESLSINERLFLAQFDTIRKIAEEGSCVIVGRCADYILRGLPYATNVFIYAEEADKIKRAVEQYGDSESQVKKIMREADKARANYYSYHTGRKWGAHVNFNLSIDSGYLYDDDIVDLIIAYTEKKIWKKSTFDAEEEAHAHV